jgi:hypothetical protein
MTPTIITAPSGLPGWTQKLPLKLLGEMAVPLAVLAIVIALIIGTLAILGLALAATDFVV